MFLYLSQMVVSETQKYKYVQKFNYPIIYNLAVLKFSIFLNQLDVTSVFYYIK